MLKLKTTWGNYWLGQVGLRRQLNITSKHWHLNPTSQRSNIIWVFCCSKPVTRRKPIGYFEQSIKLKPDSFITHNNLGTALLRTGRFEEAIEHYKQVLQLKPDYIQAYVNLASAYAKANQPAEAVALCPERFGTCPITRGSRALAKQFEDFLDSYGK